ncbi:MAG: hypothetical protein R3F43_07675 [bacterium]
MITVGHAIQLDRHVEWGEIIDACRAEADTVVVVHGPTDQALVHLVERIQRDLPSQIPGGLVVHRVPFYNQGPVPHVRVRVAAAGGREPGSGGLDLTDAARQSSDETRLLLLFEASLQPRDRRARAMIKTLVRDEVPRLVQAGRGHNPIHVVLALEVPRAGLGVPGWPR